jgi:hypothetical protein
MHTHTLSTLVHTLTCTEQGGLLRFSRLNSYPRAHTTPPRRHSPTHHTTLLHSFHLTLSHSLSLSFTHSLTLAHSVPGGGARLQKTQGGRKTFGVYLVEATRPRTIRPQRVVKRHTTISSSHLWIVDFVRGHMIPTPGSSLQYTFTGCVDIIREFFHCSLLAFAFA